MVGKFFSDFKECENGGDRPKRPTHGLQNNLREQGLTDGQISKLYKNLPQHSLK